MQESIHDHVDSDLLLLVLYTDYNTHLGCCLLQVKSGRVRFLHLVGDCDKATNLVGILPRYAMLLPDSSLVGSHS